MNEMCTFDSKINGTPKGARNIAVNCSRSVMKFDRSNKFDFCYYGQVNSLQLKSSVASKGACKHLWGVPFILLLMLQEAIVKLTYS